MRALKERIRVTRYLIGGSVPTIQPSDNYIGPPPPRPIIVRHWMSPLRFVNWFLVNETTITIRLIRRSFSSVRCHKMKILLLLLFYNWHRTEINPTPAMSQEMVDEWMNQTKIGFWWVKAQLYFFCCYFLDTLEIGVNNKWNWKRTNERTKNSTINIHLGHSVCCGDVNSISGYPMVWFVTFNNKMWQRSEPTTTRLHMTHFKTDIITCHVFWVWLWICEKMLIQDDMLSR